MFSSYQTIQKQVASFSISGASNQFTHRCRDLDLFIDGQPAHLIGYTLSVSLTPTYTTTPTLVGLMKGTFANVQFYDGRQIRLNCNGMELRNFERLEYGRLVNPDPKQAAAMSGNPRYFARHIPIGLPLFQGNPSDFAIAVANLQNGELRITTGALTDYSADTTAVVGTIEVIAHLIKLDGEIRIAPIVERQVYSLTPDDRLTAAGLYPFVGMADTSSYGNFAAATLGAFTVEAGTFPMVLGVNAPSLGRAFHAQMASGLLGGVQAEPGHATHDTNQRIPDYTGTTAIAAQGADFQPIVWSAPGCRISKVAANVRSAMRIKWSGSKTSNGLVHVTRILPSSDQLIAGQVREASQVLNVQVRDFNLKTISKKAYNGPLRPFMPYAAKL